MENKELEQYYEDLRSQINEGTPSEKKELTPEQLKEVRSIWGRYIKKMRSLKNDIEGLPEDRKVDKVEIRVL